MRSKSVGQALKRDRVFLGTAILAAGGCKEGPIVCALLEGLGVLVAVSPEVKYYFDTAMKIATEKASWLKSKERLFPSTRINSTQRKFSL